MKSYYPAFLAAVVCFSMPAFANNIGPGPKSFSQGDGSASQAQQATSNSVSGASSRSAASSRSGASAGVVVNSSNTSNNTYTGQTGAASGYSGNTNIDARSAPGFALAPLYGGGARCPTVGLTGAGSSTGGGGGAGVSWYSTDCSTVEIAEYLRSIGRPDDGTALLAHHFPELAKVLDSRQPPAQPVSDVPAKPVPGWCAKALQNHHMTEASAVYVHDNCG